MKFELKFVNNEPKAVFLSKRRSPPGSECMKFSNGGKVYVGKVTLESAMTNLVVFSETCTTLSDIDRENYKTAVMEFLDDTEESTMMMMLMPEEKWKSYIEEKNTFYENKAKSE